MAYISSFSFLLILFLVFFFFISFGLTIHLKIDARICVCILKICIKRKLVDFLSRHIGYVCVLRYAEQAIALAIKNKISFVFFLLFFFGFCSSSFWKIYSNHKPVPAVIVYWYDYYFNKSLFSFDGELNTFRLSSSRHTFVRREQSNNKKIAANVWMCRFPSFRFLSPTFYGFDSEYILWFRSLSREKKKLPKKWILKKFHIWYTIRCKFPRVLLAYNMLRYAWHVCSGNEKTLFDVEAFKCRHVKFSDVIKVPFFFSSFILSVLHFLSHPHSLCFHHKNKNEWYFSVWFKWWSWCSFVEQVLCWKKYKKKKTWLLVWHLIALNTFFFFAHLFCFSLSLSLFSFSILSHFSLFLHSLYSLTHFAHSVNCFQLPTTHTERN